MIYKDDFIEYSKQKKFQKLCNLRESTRASGDALERWGTQTRAHTEEGTGGGQRASTNARNVGRRTWLREHRPRAKVRAKEGGRAAKPRARKSCPGNARSGEGMRRENAGAARTLPRCEGVGLEGARKYRPGGRVGGRAFANPRGCGGERGGRAGVVDAVGRHVV